MCLLILSIAIMSLLAAFATRMCPDFMLMRCSVCVGAMTAKRARPANGLWLPAEESATLNIHSNRHMNSRRRRARCMLKEIGKRLGEVNRNDLLDERRGEDRVYRTMQIN